MPCKECQEQARLLGMSAERELALRAKIQDICRTFAQYSHGMVDLGTLADAIILAERLTRG